jgi:lactoylglutathione lyase
MQLAKPRVDIGLNTNALTPMLAFWQNEIGLPFDHILSPQRGMRQHRHDLSGSVLKINHYRDALPETPPSGYRELLIARDGTGSPKAFEDPDGNRVTLIAPGTLGISQIGLRLLVRDLDAHRRFYRDGLGLVEETTVDGTAFRAGETLFLLERSPDAPSDATIEGKGYRYITFQVFKVDREHAKILAQGGREAMPPRTLGETARISMVKDPDGNWIEISQRASLTGSLEP